jgi:uncharacterized protein YjlB
MWAALYVCWCAASLGPAAAGHERRKRTLQLVAGDTVVVPACVAHYALTPTDHVNVMICDPGVR